MIVVSSVMLALSIIKIYNQWSKKKILLNISMAGKVIIVTGANRGLGFQTAKSLAGMGARVILACRDENSAMAARDAIVSETGNCNVDCKRLDLGSLSSVREFSKEILDTEERLDVLVNNAGIYGLDDRYTEDDILESMQINHFGPFLLSLLLIPLLYKSKPSRIVNVSSILHFLGEVKINQLNKRNNYTFWKTYAHLRTYANSKLCNILFTVELSKRLRNTGIVANAVHPGITMTSIGQRSEWMTRALWAVWCWLCSTTIEEGTQTIIYLCAAKECADISGEYFVDCKKAKTLMEAKNPKTAFDLWHFSEQLVRHKFVI